MKLKLIASAICLATTMFGASAAVKSVDMTTLDNKITVNGKAVSGESKLPMILWGADAVTIFANGLEDKTTSSSLFGKNGFNYDLEMSNSVIKQAKNYISGKTPYFRGTLDQVALLNDLVYADESLRPVVLQQLSWSKGGDNLVVKAGINNLKDLKGKTIAIMAYGPHIYFLHRVLESAGLEISDVNIVWVENLDGDNSPFSAFYDGTIHAAFMITPDAMAVIEGDNALSGANILFSTKQADKFVADVYAVRSDFYEANKAKLEKFVHSSS